MNSKEARGHGNYDGGRRKSKNDVRIEYIYKIIKNKNQ